MTWLRIDTPLFPDPLVRVLDAPSPDQVLAELLTLRIVVDSFGNQSYWNSDNKLHRVYGPAFVYPSGGKEWYQDGKRHRIDGPAVEFASGYTAHYVNGEYLEHGEFQRRHMQCQT